ncbi:MAG: MFS transporter [Oscillospiraceae bacterium]|nr:MFS transporter [Oscillospiraceae bacterium]
MARKELGLDSMGIQKTMRFGDYMADAGGQFTLNAISGLVGAITYFYTDKVGVAALTAANVLLVAKIIDAFTDLIMGKIMDNGKSPKGKCRPWFLRMAIPTFIAIVALFTVPKGMSNAGQFAYLLGTNVFASAVVYTAISIPYISLLVMRTKSLEERNKMGIFRAAFGYIIGMIIAIALVPITNALGPNGVADQAAYIKFAVVVALIAMGLMFLIYRKSEEKAVAEEKQDDGLPFFQALGMLFKNKYWVQLLILGLFTAVTYALTSASGTYYAKWILGNDNLVALLGGVGLIPTFLGFALVGPMTKKWGIRKTLLICFVLGIAGSVVRVFFPSSLIVLLTAGMLPTFALIPMMCLQSPMNSLAVDYNDYLFDNKIIGMSASASSFGGKIASGIGGSLIGWILAAANYDPSVTEVTTSVRYGIYTFSIYLPLAMLVVMFLLVYRFDIESKYADIMKEVHARKAARSEE